MARHSKLATLASLLVILVAAAFLNYLLMARANPSGGYRLSANFIACDGIASGSDVAIAGLPVGRVTSVTLDPKTLLSHVTFEINKAIRLPTDSSIAVQSAGLTSGNELMITPGKATTRLASGSQLADARPYVSLETAIGQYIFGGVPGSQD